MKRDKWEKLLSKHKDPADNFHISRLIKIGNKKDMIRELKSFGNYEYVKSQNEDNNYHKEIAKLGNTYYWIT